jgi:hypothetical protein
VPDAHCAAAGTFTNGSGPVGEFHDSNHCSGRLQSFAWEDVNDNIWTLPEFSPRKAIHIVSSSEKLK